MQTDALCEVTVCLLPKPTGIFGKAFRSRWQNPSPAGWSRIWEHSAHSRIRPGAWSWALCFTLLRNGISVKRMRKRCSGTEHRVQKKKKTNKPLWNAAMFSFVYGINDGGVCLLKNQPLVIVRELHSECRLYWKLIASVQSEPHHKCHVEVAGSEEAMTALSALFHLKVGKTHCDRSALHQ